MFSLANVVWYDGVDSFVSKYVLETEDGHATTKARNKIIEYLSGNGELLKIDILHPVTLDTIFTYRDNINDNLKTAYNRFNIMYFG